MNKTAQIKSITVENVRGISSRKHVFETPDMLGNKFHLLVAPNGYGKSSLAAAFDSLKPRSLKIHPSLLHKDDEANKPKLEISYIEDGVEKTLKADDTCNEISKVFSISVINSKLKPRAVAKTGFNRIRPANCIYR
jgi:AAA15 family ATPase/GTPase